MSPIGRSGYLQALDRLQIAATEVVILYFLGEKKLFLCRRDLSPQVFDASHSKRRPSCLQDSLGTPWGLHEVAEKYGDGATSGEVFESRLSTGLHYRERTDAGPGQRPMVTTRILRLRGLESGLNRGSGCDSYQRYIYIHGTNHPDQFPRNLSAGCILLRDPDLIEVYDSTPIGSHIFIPQPGIT